MAKHILNIDGFIGAWGFSKRLIRNFLADAGKNSVEIKISSLGGEIDHAIDINNQFSEHGNVTAIFSGFNASSATLIALGAKTSKIADNSFYLIHKALMWVDEWGSMNPDDIDDVIAKLEKTKHTLEVVTLTLAKMYVAKTGKTINEILELMKEEKWLSADEALEMGFVDEVFTPKVAVNYFENEQTMAFMNSLDIPLPVIAKKPTEEILQSVAELKTDEGILAKIGNKIRKTFNSIKKMEKLTALLAVLGLTNLESDDDKGVYLNQEQLELLETALQNQEQNLSAKTTAEASLATAVTAFDGIDTTVAEAEGVENKVEAIRTIIAAKPAVAASGIESKDDKSITDEVDWETLNALPHMQEEVDA